MSSKVQKTVIRVIAVLLALLMAGSVLINVIGSRASAASQSALDDLKRERDAIRQQIKDINAEINSLESDRKTAVAQKEVLDSRVELTQKMIDNLTEQISEYGVLIEERENEVEKLQQEEAEQWDTYKVRMRAMEENGSISYYAIIFGANSFADLLSRIDMVSSIMDHDKNLYNNLVSAREATQQAKVALEAAKAGMEDTKAEQEEARVLLMQQVEEAGQLIAAIQADIDKAEELYAQVSAEEDRVRDEINEMEEELRRQQASNVVGTGSFLWPTDYSNRVNSPFGSRNTGISGASTYHGGIDIGADYGSNVFASDSGTVLVSTKNSSYGNYVTISHGNGFTTLYAHMSSRVVSAGQTVTRGQIIGYAGSTGISSGPHLHFEIWLNGNRVDPLNYFTNWVKNW